MVIHGIIFDFSFLSQNVKMKKMRQGVSDFYFFDKIALCKILWIAFSWCYLYDNSIKVPINKKHSNVFRTPSEYVVRPLSRIWVTNDSWVCSIFPCHNPFFFLDFCNIKMINKYYWSPNFYLKWLTSRGQPVGQKLYTLPNICLTPSFNERGLLKFMLSMLSYLLFIF